MPGLVDHHERRGVDAGDPVGHRGAGLPGLLEGVGELGQGVGLGVDLGAQGVRGRGRGSEADDGAAAVGPGAGQGSHRGGLARSGGRDRQLEPGAGGGHLADQRGLSGVEGDAVGGRLQQRQVDRVGSSTAYPSWRPAASTRRCSAASTLLEVNRSDAAGV